MSTSESTLAPRGTATTDQTPKRRESSEWFWRVIAALMVITIGWIVWIVIQLSPPPLVTNSAFEAAARARAADHAHGKLKPVGASPAAAIAKSSSVPPPPAAATPLATAISTPATASKPPVDVDRLRLADSITTPLTAPPGVMPAAQ